MNLPANTNNKIIHISKQFGVSPRMVSAQVNGSTNYSLAKVVPYPQPCTYMYIVYTHPAYMYVYT